MDKKKEKPLIIAGPCLLESEKQGLEIAEFVKEQGADVFRAKYYMAEGTHKPKRGKSYEAQTTKWFHKIKRIMPIASEIGEDSRFCELDYIWTPARQMQNYCLLEKVNCCYTDISVILKRHFGCTIDEVVGATEYLEDIKELWICERGIVSFDRQEDIRWRPDILGIVQLKEKGFRVMFDPSHSCGKAEYVIPMSLAALATGADGLMIEVHKNPKESWSDQKQALDFGRFKELMQEIKKCHG